MDFEDSFIIAYHFRLLYVSSALMYPIMGALRKTYDGDWQVQIAVAKSLGPASLYWPLVCSSAIQQLLSTSPTASIRLKIERPKLIHSYDRCSSVSTRASARRSTGQSDNSRGNQDQQR